MTELKYGHARRSPQRIPAYSQGLQRSMGAFEPAKTVCALVNRRRKEYRTCYINFAMVKGRFEPGAGWAPGRYHTERRPDRSADKEDTYGGYDMHFTLYAHLRPLQKDIPMLQIGFSGALMHLPIRLLRLPGIENTDETIRLPHPKASAALCRELILPVPLVMVFSAFSGRDAAIYVLV